jgi:protein-L-isoaspartate(D-aspartate) O-methyltransferase
LPIGLEQTISQPYIVALMTELARVMSDQPFLKLAPVLDIRRRSFRVKHVYTIECCAVGEAAQKRLAELGYR